jgi:hypothetical protein
LAGFSGKATRAIHLSGTHINADRARITFVGAGTPPGDMATGSRHPDIAATHVR